MSFVLAVVPARGGSKGIPRKNLRTLLGKPLINHAIECGLSCPDIDAVIVSTEDDEIARIARRAGADVPFMRPAALASDSAPMLPVLQHAVVESERHYCNKVELLVLLDPTGPLRTCEDIEHCISLIRQTGCDAVISGNKAHRSPYFNMVTPDGEYLKLAMTPPREVGCRQDSPVVYDLNTVVWIYSRRALMEEEARIPRKSKLYLVPPDRALDVDSELDLDILQLVCSRSQEALYSG